MKVAYCSLAQSVERMTVNHDVVSSSLTGAATKKHHPSGGVFLWLFLSAPIHGTVVGSRAFTAERLREVGGSRLRAPPVADAASKKAGAAVEMRRREQRATHFGHRKRKHDGRTCTDLECAFDNPSVKTCGFATSLYTREARPLLHFCRPYAMLALQ